MLRNSKYSKPRDKTVLKKDRKKPIKTQTHTLKKIKKENEIQQLTNNSKIIEDRLSQEEKNQISSIFNQNDEMVQDVSILSINCYQFSKSDEERIKFIQIIEHSFKKQKEKLLMYEEHSSNIFSILQEKNYFITEYCASGGQADIFFGYQVMNDNEDEIEEYAFKIYLNIDEEDVMEEIEIMIYFYGQINIIKLYDALKIDEEKCQFSLNDELKDIDCFQKEVSIEQLFQIIFELIDGLIQFRIYKTLHLDIKPTNILKNQQGTYVYSDFGCSLQIKKDEQKKIKGFTQKYASYEQLNHNTDQINYQSDIQSLGKTFKSIIDVFKIVDSKTIRFYDSIVQMIDNKMDNNNIQQREELKNIHSLFFELFLNHEQLPSFLQSYQYQIGKIKHQINPTNLTDKKYFVQVKLYYSKLHVDILKYLKTLYDSQENKSITKEINQSNNTENLSDVLQVQNKSTLENQIEEKYYRSQIASSLQFLGECYLSLGQPQEALKIAKESHEMLKQLYQGSHLLISSSLRCLSKCYTELGDSQNALEYAKESLQMDEQQQENYQSLINSMYILSQCYSDIGDKQNALYYAKKSLQMKQKLFQGNDPSISFSFRQLSNLHLTLADSKKLQNLHQNLFKQNKIFIIEFIQHYSLLQSFQVIVIKIWEIYQLLKNMKKNILK